MRPDGTGTARGAVWDWLGFYWGAAGPGGRAAGVLRGVVLVDEGERAPWLQHGVLRVLSQVARNSVKRNFGAVRCAFDGGSRTAGTKGNVKGSSEGNHLESLAVAGFLLFCFPCFP